MKPPFDAKVLNRCTVHRDLDGFIRLFPARFESMPLGVGSADNRFAAQGDQHRLLFAGENLQTSFAEVVVRDRFQSSAPPRELPWCDIRRLSLAHIYTRPAVGLRLLDLNGANCTVLGIPTDVIGARNQSAGQALGRRVHHHHPDIDGFVYPSRLTKSAVVAIFERAIDEALVCPADQVGRLDSHPSLRSALDFFHISRLI